MGAVVLARSHMGTVVVLYIYEGSPCRGVFFPVEEEISFEV